MEQTCDSRLLATDTSYCSCPKESRVECGICRALMDVGVFVISLKCLCDADTLNLDWPLLFPAIEVHGHIL